ncbi:hypothetical protein [Dickeya phage Sucellus]|nr:hypothetical protein [Dickeya phage Sucellus]
MKNLRRLQQKINMWKPQAKPIAKKLKTLLLNRYFEVIKWP